MGEFRSGLKFALVLECGFGNRSKNTIICTSPMRYSWNPIHTTALCFALMSSLPTAVGQDASVDFGDTKYVGTEKCVECHKEQHASYLQTTHSKAARWTDASTEPIEGAFYHDASENTYKAIHRDGKLLHQEIQHRSDGKKVLQTEADIVFSIGSGAHGISYVFRDGDFWVQSPVSWFKDSKSWGMSPGFDQPLHTSFTRSIRSGCVFCHVGSIDAKKGNPFAFDITEATIGCERCHGPGDKHVKKYAAAKPGQKLTGAPFIVNPDKLSRELSESICHQCHLQGAAKAIVSDKNEWDYRPGTDLTDVRVDYQYETGEGKMRIVGHVEQMHASECYKQTETLSCVTCHDPHNPVKPEQAVKHFRSVCYSCHQDEACGKPHAERIELAANDCAKCHMPKRDTNVAHAAFSQHRIGIYQSSSDSYEKANGLIAVVAPTNASVLERKRLDAIAKYKIFQSRPGNQLVELGLESATSLVKLKEAGANEETLNATLAQLCQEQGQAQIAMMLSSLVVKQQPKPTLSHIQANDLLAQSFFRRNDFKRALTYYRNSSTYRRRARDHYYLALCENNTGNIPGAIAALGRALEIDPLLEPAHAALQAIYQAGKKPEKSKHHQQESIRIRQRLQRLEKKVTDQSKN